MGSVTRTVFHRRVDKGSSSEFPVGYEDQCNPEECQRA